jgi:hypothetical protein
MGHSPILACQKGAYFPDTRRAPVEFTWKLHSLLQVFWRNSLRTLYLTFSEPRNLKGGVLWTHATSGICHVTIKSCVMSLELRIRCKIQMIGGLENEVNSSNTNSANLRN